MSGLGHSPVDTVRSYLLGQLNAAEADSLEDTYFCDRAEFLHMREVERRLILDYLAKRLSGNDLAAFEDRYLRIPDLQLRLEEVRQQTTQAGSPARLWKVAMAAGLAVALGFGAWFAFAPRLATTEVADQAAPQLRLSPGVTMGAGSAPRIFTLPDKPAPVWLVLDLPGQTGPLACDTRLSQVMEDGTWKEVWRSPKPQTSQAAPGGQQVLFQIGFGVIDAQDYVVEVLGPDHQVIETYAFGGRR